VTSWPQASCAPLSDVRTDLEKKKKKKKKKYQRKKEKKEKKNSLAIGGAFLLLFCSISAISYRTAVTPLSLPVRCRHRYLVNVLHSRVGHGCMNAGG